ncbi:MAG: hypothetical protein ACR2QE_18280 [Acidimicrobiales bacterium]
MGYRGKTDEQGRARELRAEAWTLQDIADELHVAKSSVSLWVRDVEFEPQPRRTARRRGPNKLQRAKAAEIEQCRVEGIAEVGQLSDREFLMAGLALYAGDGTKVGSSVNFANSNPEIIRFYCTWLRRFFDIDEGRLRARLYLHQGLDLEAAMTKWTSITGIPATHFNQPYRAVPDATIRTNKHQYGCAHVRYSCVHSMRRLLGLMEALISSPFDLPG